MAYLARNRRATPTELAEALGMTKSTTYRLVERLRQGGWVHTEGYAGNVRLGPSAAQLAAAATATPLRDVALPALKDLLAFTRETVSLAVPNELSMIFIHRERGPQPVGVSAELGAARPLHSTSVGRAYLAALPDDQCQRVLDELVRSPDSPVTAATLPELEDVLRLTRRRGWSSDQREFDRSSCCCGAAIRDHTGTPIAAISVAGVAERMEPELESVGPMVQKTAQLISEQLGWLPKEESAGPGDLG